MYHPVLYTNAQGRPVTHGSYSARRLFRYCPRLFKLERVDGWKQIEERASALFGKCNEAAHQWHEENGRQLGTGIAKFTELWNNVAAMPGADKFVYADYEGDWAGLLRAGQEMQRLYEIKAPSLPISLRPRPRFQVPLRKKIFPGTELDVLENVAYLDILSFPDWDHPMLVHVPRPEGAEFRPLIIDAKTSGVDLIPELIPLDPQLAEYAWQSRIPDVAFLWFVKHSHTLERRNRITTLEFIDGIPAGTDLFVLGVQRPEKVKPPKPPKKKKGEETDVSSEALLNTLADAIVDSIPSAPVSNEIERVFLGDAHALQAFYDHTRAFHPSSNAYKEACATFYQARFVVSCTPNQITKQRLQFAAVRLDEEFINETGIGVGQDTVNMIKAHEEQFYPRTGGIRYPDQKCNNCSMRGICGNNPELRDKLLTRAGEEWFSGIETGQEAD